MKKIKLLTPIFTLATTASVVMPLVACNKGPEDPENFVGVVVTESDEDVQLEKNKAEIDKKFETLVYFDSTFAVNKVTVKVGGTGLVEGDVTSGFSYDYINNILTIAEGVIHDKVELTFKFCYVTNDIVTYSP
ncbi:MAG: hypothetical protein MJ195_01900 [Mycoplasmoidaceae bacterium]|nr:hypothetical protein [Mycoplasmoidaceae bacterium]